MTSEAGARPLRERLAATGTPREQAPKADQSNGHGSAARRSTAPRSNGRHGPEGTDGHGRMPMTKSIANGSANHSANGSANGSAKAAAKRPATAGAGRTSAAHAA